MRRWSDWMSLPGDPNVALIWQPCVVVGTLAIARENLGATRSCDGRVTAERGRDHLDHRCRWCIRQNASRNQIADAIKQLLQGSGALEVALSGQHSFYWPGASPHS